MYKHLQHWMHPSNFMLDAENTALRERSYVIYGRHRGSDLLTDVNFDGIYKALKDKENTLLGTTYYLDQPDESWVYIQRDSCSFAGWVEAIYITDDAPKPLLDYAEEILHDLDGHPVFNEDAWSEAEDDAVNKYWEEANTWEKANLIVEHCDVDAEEAEKMVSDGEFPDEVYYAMRDWNW